MALTASATTLETKKEDIAPIGPKEEVAQAPKSPNVINGIAFTAQSELPRPIENNPRDTQNEADPTRRLSAIRTARG
jgi:hypothetical protein